MADKTEEKLKKQEQDILQLKKAVNQLTRQIGQLQLTATRLSHKNRTLEQQLAQLQRIVKNV